jgi:hypothetical protein
MVNQLKNSNFYIGFFKCWIIPMLGFGLACLAQADNALITFDNSYTAKLYGFSIDVNSRVIALSEDHYELSFSARSAFGSINETSKIKWNAHNQTVMPLHYLYKRSGLGKSKKEELQFDWENNTINNLTNNTNWPIKAAHRMQDSLSYQLQLRQDLLAGKKEFFYPITHGNTIKEYRFEIVGEEVLKTPLGDVNTVKVKRSYTNDSRVTFAWFAQKFQYLLVRLQQEENGSAYTIYLSKATLDGKAIEHF